MCPHSFFIRVMLLFGVVGFIVWERIRNFLNSAKIPTYRSLAAAGWLDTATRRHPIGICRSRILHTGKSNNRDTI